MTGLALNRVSKERVSRLASLTAEKSSQLVSEPKKKFFSTARNAKEDLLFRKSYKQSFLDEVLTIIKNTTFNQTTFHWLRLKTKVFKVSFLNQNRSTSYGVDEPVVYLEPTSLFELLKDTKMMFFLQSICRTFGTGEPLTLENV